MTGPFFNDVRFSFRSLVASPWFAVAAVLTLAMAIGANSVVFSVMNSFLLRPLNVPNADTLFELEHGNDAFSYQSYPDYVDLRDRNRTFESLIAYNIAQAGLDSAGTPARAWVAKQVVT